MKTDAYYSCHELAMDEAIMTMAQMELSSRPGVSDSVPRKDEPLNFIAQSLGLATMFHTITCFFGSSNKDPKGHSNETSMVNNKKPEGFEPIIIEKKTSESTVATRRTEPGSIDQRDNPSFASSSAGSKSSRVQLRDRTVRMVKRFKPKLGSKKGRIANKEDVYETLERDVSVPDSYAIASVDSNTASSTQSINSTTVDKFCYSSNRDPRKKLKFSQVIKRSKQSDFPKLYA